MPAKEYKLMKMAEFVVLPKEERAAYLAALTQDERLEFSLEYIKARSTLRQAEQLTYYQPVSEEVKKFHASACHTIAAFGGNGSSKTTAMLVEAAIMATGEIPDSLKDIYPKEKLRVGGKFRIVVESISNVLETVILPKLNWTQWHGIDAPGGKRGYWGWIPRRFLINGDWRKSWNTKSRTLKLANGAVFQFFSHDQDPSDFASGDLDAVFHDELPKYAIWRENEARVARMGGYMFLAMTPPDEAGIDVGWLFDKVYEKGIEGSASRDPDYLCVNLFSEHNTNINQEQVLARAKQWTWEQRETRLHGRFIHLSNLIHPLFTDTILNWCFECNAKFVAPHAGRCPRCEGDNFEPFCHVEDFEYQPTWPVVFLVDPHPRKPNMMTWAAIDPYDDVLIVAEKLVDGEPKEVKKQVDNIESEFGFQVARRLMDPNMGASPGQKKRGKTWQQDFDSVGLRCDLADDGFVTGRGAINDMLKPDENTRMPRYRVHPRCQSTIHQFKRYLWAEWARYSAEEKDPKGVARSKDDDFPTLSRYLMNSDPSFESLRGWGQVWKPQGKGRNVRTGY